MVVKKAVVGRQARAAALDDVNDWKAEALCSLLSADYIFLPNTLNLLGPEFYLNLPTT